MYVWTGSLSSLHVDSFGSFPHFAVSLCFKGNGGLGFGISIGFLLVLFFDCGLGEWEWEPRFLLYWLFYYFNKQFFVVCECGVHRYRKVNSLPVASFIAIKCEILGKNWFLIDVYLKLFFVESACCFILLISPFQLYRYASKEMVD